MPFFIDRIEGGQALIEVRHGRRLRLGRGTNADVRFDDTGVDLEHAVIDQDESGYTIHDRGSVTGTFVNEEPIQSARLAHDDRIQIGTYRIDVELLGPDDPLFLHVAQIGEEAVQEVTRGTMLGTLRVASQDLFDLGEPGSDLTMRYGSLIAAFEEVEESIEAEEPEEEVADDAAADFAARLLVGEEPEEPTPEPVSEPAGERLETTPPSQSPIQPPAKPTAPPSGPRVPTRDYASLYRLDRGLLRKSVFAVLLCALAAGTLWALVQSGRQDVFSPGDLSAVHARVTRESCTACHQTWKRLTDAGCRSSGCHATVGEHQPFAAASLPCLACHTEHRDLQDLRLLDEHRCVECHRDLERFVPAASLRVAPRITGFGEGQHPDFEFREDPGALQIDHARHLALKQNGAAVLTCASCHTRDAAGEIAPIAFEKHCQRCHNLGFDLRFGDQEAPHATPREVLTYLAGFYSLRPAVLRSLGTEERNRLRGRRLSVEQQLSVVAEWNALSLMRNKCRKCHRFTSEPGRVPLAELAVVPVRLRELQLVAARYRHAPHLERGLECQKCHPKAVESHLASDVLTPSIGVCRECHRPPRPDETPGSGSLGRDACIACHVYHPPERPAAAPEPKTEDPWQRPGSGA